MRFFIDRISKNSYVFVDRLNDTRVTIIAADMTHMACVVDWLAQNQSPGVSVQVV